MNKSTHLTAQQKLQLQAAFGDATAAVTAWPAWRNSVDWEEHLEHDSFRLLPQLARNLRRHGIDDPLLPRLEGIGRQAWYANQHRLAALTPALHALSGMGILPLVSFPWSLVALQGRMVLEPHAGFSCTVLQDQHERAVAGLAKEGWRPNSDRIPKWAATGFSLWAGVLVLEKDGANRIQLHRQGGHLNEGVFERARPGRLGNARVLLPGPADMLHDVCRKPPAPTLFGRVVTLLVHAAAFDESPDVSRFLQRLEGFPVDRFWREAFKVAADFWPGGLPEEVVPLWDALPTPEDSRDSPPRGGFIQRLKVYWGEYRTAWGEAYSLPSALGHLPGYLMGRWNMISPGALPKTLLQALWGEWRLSRRGR